VSFGVSGVLRSKNLPRQVFGTFGSDGPHDTTFGHRGRVGRPHPCLTPPSRPSNPGMPAGIRGGRALRGWAEDAGLAPSPPTCSAPAPRGGQEWSRVALVCTPVWSRVAATYEWCESPLDSIAEAGRLGACELGACYRVCEAHAAAVCRATLSCWLRDGARATNRVRL